MPRGKGDDEREKGGKEKGARPPTPLVVTRFDPGTCRVVERVDLPPPKSDAGPRCIVGLAFDGRALWVAYNVGDGKAYAQSIRVREHAGPPRRLGRTYEGPGCWDGERREAEAEDPDQGVQGELPGVGRQLGLSGVGEEVDRAQDQSADHQG